MKLFNKMKKHMVLSIIIVLIVGIFVVPNPNVYTQLGEYEGNQKRDYISIFSSCLSQFIIDNFDVIDETPEKKFGKPELTLGAQKSFIYYNKQYLFYRTKNNDKILVHIINQSDNKESYTIIDSKTFNRFAKISGYTDYDNLYAWYI